MRAFWYTQKATSACRKRSSAPGEARTRNLWIRSPLLYPIELRGQTRWIIPEKSTSFGIRKTPMARTQQITEWAILEHHSTVVGHNLLFRDRSELVRELAGNRPSQAIEPTPAVKGDQPSLCCLFVESNGWREGRDPPCASLLERREGNAEVGSVNSLRLLARRRGQREPADHCR